MAEVYRIEIPINIKDNTDPGVSQAKNKLNAFDKASQRTQERLEQMNKTKYQIVLDAMDRASSIVGKVSSKARSIAGKTFSFTMKVIDLATAPLRSLWNFRDVHTGSHTRRDRCICRHLQADGYSRGF
ncbi:MAG: hypothetical protein ACOX6S_09245 [Clostridia bacterium]